MARVTNQPSRLAEKSDDTDLDKGVETFADQAEAVLQHAIIHGDLLPDTRLTIPVLATRFGIGATPLREGLSRLVARGLVTMIGNRGFRVAPVSREDLEDLIKTRFIVESGALRLSMARRDSEWERGMLSAMQRLKKVVEQSDTPITEANADYFVAHRAFHMSLLAGARSERLAQLQSELYDQAYRYRRVFHTRGFDRDRAVDEHQRLVDVAMGSDVETACSALDRHLRITLEAFLEW